MNYLISQITISLLLAAIVGAAVGWIIHRSKAGKQIRSLQQVVGRQQQHVNEAQTEVSIISGDFDDLKQRSETEISALRSENQKIPALHQNLEKSQLLVRQLMQQHKAEVDELSVANEKLSGKAKLADEREQAIKKLQAELNSNKRSNLRSEDQGSENQGSENTDQQTVSKADHSSSKAKSAGGQNGNGDSVTEHEIVDEKSASTKATTASVNNGTSQNHSKIDKAQPIDNSDRSDKTSEQQVASENGKADNNKANFKRLPLSSNTSDSSASEASGIASLTGLTAKTVADSSATTTVDSKRPDRAQTELELEALRDQLADDAQQPVNSNALAAGDQDYFGSNTNSEDVTQLFDPVDQHDDLKQIFGIGPVTEKTLNKLGITSYSQLAELKQHDIKKIADALQIFPGRIERDNWVGSARSQLEEVLEEL